MNLQKGTLLIVDDDRVVANTTALIFTHEGYEARVAYSAEEALELIHDWQPSAAILDVLLPKMDGITLAAAIQAIYPDCRVALFTTQTFSSDPLAAAQTDLPMMIKPIHPDQLVAFVSDSIAATRTTVSSDGLET